MLKIKMTIFFPHLTPVSREKAKRAEGVSKVIKENRKITYLQVAQFLEEQEEQLPPPPEEENIGAEESEPPLTLNPKVDMSFLTSLL